MLVERLSQLTWIPAQGQSLPSCAMLSTTSNLPKPQFPYLENGYAWQLFRPLDRRSWAGREQDREFTHWYRHCLQSPNLHGRSYCGTCRCWQLARWCGCWGGRGGRAPLPALPCNSQGDRLRGEKRRDMLFRSVRIWPSPSTGLGPSTS